MVGSFRSGIASRNSGLRGNKDMGPLYTVDETGESVIPLWQNWLANNGFVEEIPDCTYNSERKNGRQPLGCCIKDGYDSCGVVGGQNVFCLRNSFNGSSTPEGAVSCCFNDLVCDHEGSDALFAPPGTDGVRGPYDADPKCFRSNRADDFRTCSPESRNLGGIFCRNSIEKYCTGEEFFPGQASWEDLWDENAEVDVNELDDVGFDSSNIVKGPCVKFLMRQIAGINGCNTTFDNFKILPQTFDLDGMLYARGLIQTVLQKYISEYGSPILGPSDDGIEAGLGVTNFIFNICQKFPALCTDALYDMCRLTTEQQLSQDPVSNLWCGCYMPEKQYVNYTETNLVDKQCTPFCSRNGVIPLVDAAYQPLICQENVCIINDIALDLVKSEGIVTFKNICNSCGDDSNGENVNGDTGYKENFYGFEKSKEGNEDPLSRLLGITNDTNYNYYSSAGEEHAYGNGNYQKKANTCSCILNDLTLEALNSKIGNVNFSTNCGSLNCTDKRGNSIACSGKGNQGPPLPDPQKYIDNLNNANSISLIKKLFILGLFVFVLIVLFYVFFGKSKKIFIDNIGDLIIPQKGQKFTYSNGIITQQ